MQQHRYKPRYDIETIFRAMQQRLSEFGNNSNIENKLEILTLTFNVYIIKRLAIIIFIYMFIQTENTPNPNAIKFFPGLQVSPDQPIFFSDLLEVKGKSKLAELLFSIANVKSVFFGSDFITITKQDEGNWQVLKPEILMTVMDHFVAGFPVFEESNLPADHADKYNNENLSEIEKQIIEIIETRVRPSVAMDGGDIVYKGFENGIVKLELHGSCAGCPSSSITLKNGIESMLKHFVPEVESVEAVEEG